MAVRLHNNIDTYTDWSMDSFDFVLVATKDVVYKMVTNNISMIHTIRIPIHLAHFQTLG